MQLLTFTVAGLHHAIESRCVVEVLPRVPARPLPRAPEFLLGIFTYRGTLVPLVDLARRLGVAPPTERLSTRVIVVEFAAGPPSDGPAETVRLGLVAENVVAIRSAEETGAALPSLQPSAGCLGRILMVDGQAVQLVDVTRILPADLLAGLASPAPAAAEAG